MAVNPERTDANDRIIHRIAYTLVTYRVDVTAIHVASVPVRYYARGRGGRPGDAAPAGEINVPPLSVAVGSTVPVIEQAIALRQPAGVRPAPAALRLAQPVGLGLVLLAIVPAAFSVLGVAVTPAGGTGRTRPGRATAVTADRSTGSSRCSRNR